jgi:putative ABC transport system permease protein
MKLFVRSIQNVLRSPFRMVLVLVLLGASLMFVAAMVSLSANSQQELDTVHKTVGTTITITYTANDANAGPTTGGSGGSGGSGPVTFTPTPIPNSAVSKVKSVPGVVSTQETLTRADQDGTLQGGTITAPNGQQFTAPVVVNGISSDATNFTLSGGAMPTLVAGRAFQASDANADVAMMSQAVAQANGLSVGSTFTLKGTTFTLIGLYTTSNQLAGSSIVIPIAAMEKAFDVDGVDSITATAASYEQVDAVTDRLRNVLGSAYNVVTQAAQYSNVFSALQVAQTTIQVALVISLVIAAVVTIYAVVMLVRERIAEIAILRTLGASHWQVLRQFWTEIVAVSGMAAAIAIILLVTLGPFISQKFDIDPASLVNTTPGPGSGGGLFIRTAGGASASTATNPLQDVHLASAALNAQTLLIILGVGLGLALLSSLIPTWVVSHTKPARVLRQAA